VKEGRGSPHGGVFLDIAWIKARIPNAPEHIKKKLPSMYHQFKELAGVDITTEPMEVGPTCHYIMGGIRVDGASQMSTVPGLFAAGECAAGLHGANRLGGNSLSDLLVFGKRAGEFAAKFALGHASGAIDIEQVERTANTAESLFAREAGSDNAFKIQHDLQRSMHANVGIVRTESEMQAQLPKIEELRERAAKVGVTGNREYNPGWHTALDLANLLTVSEAVTRAAIERKESRGGHFRDDFPEKSDEFGRVNIVVRKGDSGMEVVREPVIALSEEQKAIIEEMK
jgi:succinate dehydrogenase / fumarate reductase flavoprotein subunit